MCRKIKDNSSRVGEKVEKVKVEGAIESNIKIKSNHLDARSQLLRQP